MALLNVREKRVEATIAYVGRSGAAKAQVERLRASGAAGPSTALDLDGASALEATWLPEWSVAGDVDVTVKLVLSEEGPAASLARPARSADGVVLVVGDAREHLAESLAVRDALEEELSERDTPVVVQLARDDSADVVPLAELVEKLRLDAWSRTTKPSEHDAREAVGLVLDAVARTLVTIPDEEAPPDATPLLDALRSAISESLHATSSELGERWAGELRATSESSAAAIAGRVDRVGERVAALSPSVAALDAHLRELGASLATTSDSVARISTESRTGTRQLDAALAATRKEIEAHSALARKAVAEAEEAKAAAARALTRLDTLERTLTRAIEAAAARAERAAKETSEPLSQLIARVGELADAVRAADTRSTERAGALERAASAAADPAAKALARLNELPASLSKLDAHADGRNGRLEALVRASAEQSDARVTALTQAVEALLEELKTKKKGWFG